LVNKFYDINMYMFLEEVKYMEDREADISKIKEQAATFSQSSTAAPLNLGLKAKSINNTIYSNRHRLKREKRQKSGKTTGVKKIKQDRLTRKIRGKKIHQLIWSNYCSRAKKSFKNNTGGSGVMINFVGNALNVGGYVKGHSRRSVKPIISRMKMDFCNIIDEYNTTNLRSNCYIHTSYLELKRGDKYVRI
jgi:hypothetical protein